MSEPRRLILPAPVVPVVPPAPKPRGGRRQTTWSAEQAREFGRRGGQARARREAEARAVTRILAGEESATP